MLEHSEKSNNLQTRLKQFMESHVYPNEREYANQRDNASERFAPLPLIEQLKQRAKAEGLWNLFISREFQSHGGAGLTNLEYAPLAEIMGRVLWSSEVIPLLVLVCVFCPRPKPRTLRASV